MRSFSEALSLPKYDALDPAVMENPYPTYAMLRAAGRICRGGPGLWVVTHHADVTALLKDHRLGNHLSAEQARYSFGETGIASFFERIILNVSPPRHTYLRKLMGAAFSPTRVRGLTATITRVVDELLVPTLDSRELEVVRDLAIPLPVRVVCALIGIPFEELDVVQPRAALLCKAFGTRIPEHERQEVDEALRWLRDYIGAMARERESRPGEDLLSTMLGAQSGAEAVTREAVIDNVVFLFFAGFETTRNLIATGCEALCAWPDQFGRLRANPGLLPRAVDEFLRYDTPIQVAGRRVLEPVEIDGLVIRRDRMLTLLLGSANHDEAVFDRPETLDIARSPNPHVSFGGGIHYCLGALLARTEAMSAFGRLASRFAAMELTGSPVRALSASFRSYSQVPVRVRPA
jgi:cytochrome P450